MVHIHANSSHLYQGLFQMNFILHQISSVPLVPYDLYYVGMPWNLLKHDICECPTSTPAGSKLFTMSWKGITWSKYTESNVCRVVLYWHEVWRIKGLSLGGIWWWALICIYNMMSGWGRSAHWLPWTLSWFTTITRLTVAHIRLPYGNFNNLFQVHFDILVWWAKLLHSFAEIVSSFYHNLGHHSDLLRLVKQMLCMSLQQQ